MTDPRPARRRVASAALSGLLALVSLLLAAEFFSFVYVHYIARLAWAPAYIAGPSTPRRVTAWSIDDAPWGAWRYPNATTRHESACFSVPMSSNSVGARDRERSRDGQATAPGRVVVLGDSFAEGWGVADADRLSNILEARTGHEYLNFAVPSAGPAQYLEIYERLASGFAHDSVMVVLLPANDFTDNDPARRGRGGDGPQRHHRYIVPVLGGGFRIVAPLAQEGGRGLDHEPPRGWLNRVEKTIRDNLWLHGAIGHVKNILGADASWSGYYDTTPAQLAAVEWALGRIRALAAPRPVTLVLAPRLNDFIRARAAPPPPLLPALEKFAAAQGMTLIDLLGPMRARDPDGTRLYNACDGHWNEAGNALAAEVLLAAMKGQPR